MTGESNRCKTDPLKYPSIRLELYVRAPCVINASYCRRSIFAVAAVFRLPGTPLKRMNLARLFSLKERKDKRRIGNPMGFREASLTPGVAVNRRFWVGKSSDLQKSLSKKPLEFAPQALPDAWRVAASGHSPGIRHEPPPDERRLVLFSHLPTATRRCADRTRSPVRSGLTNPAEDRPSSVPPP